MCFWSTFFCCQLLTFFLLSTGWIITTLWRWVMTSISLEALYQQVSFPQRHNCRFPYRLRWAYPYGLRFCHWKALLFRWLVKKVVIASSCLSFWLRSRPSAIILPMLEIKWYKKVISCTQLKISNENEGSVWCNLQAQKNRKRDEISYAWLICYA